MANAVVLCVEMRIRTNEVLKVCEMYPMHPFYYHILQHNISPQYIHFDHLITSSHHIIISPYPINNQVKSGLDVIESRRAFVRFVSHEVRTPLSTAIMGLQLLLEEANEEQTTAAAAVVATMVDESVSSRRQEQKDMLRYGIHHTH